MEQFGTNHGQSFLSNCDTAMQKSREDKKKCWIPSIKTHTQKTIIITRVRYLSLLQTTVIDLGKKKQKRNKLQDNTQRQQREKKILLNFAILFKKKHEKEEKSRKENK